MLDISPYMLYHTHPFDNSSGSAIQRRFQEGLALEKISLVSKRFVMQQFPDKHQVASYLYNRNRYFRNREKGKLGPNMIQLF